MKEEQGPSLPVVAAFGDSLVAGWGLPRPSDALPARLEEELAALGRPCRVLDFGVSGDTALDGLERLPEVLAAKPAAALVEFGANDCFQGIPVEETKQALAGILAALREAGVPVALAGWRTRADLFETDPELAGLVPLAPPCFTPSYVKKFNQLHANFAQAYNLPLLPHVLDPIDSRPDAARYYQADGVHPNAEGVKLLAKALAPLLAPLLPPTRTAP